MKGKWEMALKHMKIWSSSILVIEMEVKMTWRYCFDCTELSKLK